MFHAQISSQTALVSTLLLAPSWGDKVPSRLPADGDMWKEKKKTTRERPKETVRDEEGIPSHRSHVAAVKLHLHRISPPSLSPLASAVSPECLT